MKDLVLFFEDEDGRLIVNLRNLGSELILELLNDENIGIEKFQISQEEKEEVLGISLEDLIAFYERRKELPDAEVNLKILKDIQDRWGVHHDTE